MKTMLTLDDFSFLLATMNESIKEITENQEANKEAMYNRIESELQGVQQELWSSYAVSTAPLLEGTTEEGDEPFQLYNIADTVEVHLRKAQEEIVQSTQALKQAQEEIIEQRWVAQQEKDTLQAKVEEDKVKIQNE